MKFFKCVLSDLLGKRKVPEYRLKADVGECGWASSIRMQGEENGRVARERSWCLSRER